MKKLVSLFFATVSTMFLAIGAARAAEKFDSNAGKSASLSEMVMEGPTAPCVIGEN